MGALIVLSLFGLLLSLANATPSSYGLTWRNCSATDPAGLSCGTMQVPLHWGNPREGNISLGVMRFKSANPAKRIGNLFLNFGGPGASAVPWINRTAYGTRHYWSTDLTEHFDLIGLDPRGVGMSSPIKCDPELWNERPKWYPSNEQEFDRMVARNKAIGESCLNLTGPLLGHIDTTSAALDMEALRVALDDGKLNYIGYSYGSQLGTQYAEIFPNNFRVMAVDGALDHAQTETNMFNAEGATAQDVFIRFTKWCAGNSTCALYGQDSVAAFESLVATATTKPIPAPGCLDPGAACRSDVTAEDILFMLQTWLVNKYNPPTGTTSYLNWPGLAEAIVQGLDGNATLFSPHVYDSQLSNDYAGIAITCLDWFHASADTLAKVKYKQQLAALIAPNTKGYSQTYQIQAACVGWPVPLVNPPRFMNIKNTVPILMINSVHDPMCSLVWAHSLKEQIQNVVLLTRNGDGHTSHFIKGETAKAIDAYLINGTLPAQDTMLDT